MNNLSHLYSVNPIVRLPVQMRECENNDCIFLNGLEDLEGEFMNDVPPDFFALWRPCLRVLLNADKGIPDLRILKGSLL